MAFLERKKCNRKNQQKSNEKPTQNNKYNSVLFLRLLFLPFNFTICRRLLRMESRGKLNHSFRFCSFRVNDT